MGCAVFYGFLRVVEFHEAVNEPAGEAVAAAYAIQNLQILAVGGFEELAARPTDGTPIIASGRLYGAQGGGSDLEIRIRLYRFFDHFLEGGDIDFGDMFVDAFDFKTEASGEVFFVADHDIDAGSNFLVDLLSPFLAA